MSNVVFVALLLAAFAAAEAVYYFVRYLSERPAAELRRRLRTVGSASGELQILRRRRLAGSQALNDLLSGLPVVEKLERLLDQTDMEMSVARLMTTTAALFALGIGGAIVLRHPLLAVVAGPALGALPLLAVFQARATRAKKVDEQLPDTLEMIARAVKAGHALPSSFKLVAQECPPPVAVEFAKAYEQQNLGLSLEAAVHSMAERVPGSLDLKLLAVSVGIQRETGGNLVEMLENIADTMRERFKFYSKLRAITAEARISGIVLGALPIGTAMLIAVTNPGYLSELGHGLGRMILVGGIVLWVVGVLWVRALMKVTY